MLDEAAPVAISSLVVNRQDARPAGDQPEDRPARSPAGDRAAAPGAQRRGPSSGRAARMLLGYLTTNSGMTLGVGVDHVIETACSCQTVGPLDDDDGRSAAHRRREPGRPDPHHQVRDLPGLAQHPGLRARRAVPPHPGPRGPGRVRRARREPAREPRPVLGPRRRAGEGPAQSGAAPAGGPVEPVPARPGVLARRGAGVPAKGLTGQAYEGHYFWDTEIYVLPFLAYTQPRIARNLLRFRHGMLDRARERAAEMSQRGALFPWRTINGEEASSNFQPGTAQYHINADIAFAIRQYADVRATWHCSARSARRSSSRPPGCGRTSASTAPTASSTSTASPGRTSTPPSSTTTPTRT